VVVLGRTSLAEDPGYVEAAARILHASFPKATFLPALRRANVNGAIEMGMSPGLLPGRVALGAATPAGWATAPTATGRSTAAQLAALADGSQRALFVLGADLTTDLADAALLERALAAGAPLVAVTGHGGPLLEHAQVVLPAAVAHERGGTTTNIEGRVSRLGQKVVAPGLAWTDWMIAAELAAELGADLGFATTEEVTDAIAQAAPSHAGIDRARLEAPDAIDGLLVPLSRSQSDATDRRVDPVAVPGLSGVPQVGLGAYAGVVRSEAAGETASAGELLSASALEGIAVPVAPAPDNYSLRLVATRTLYDEGAMVAASPALRALKPRSVVRANPYDLDRIGAADGSEVTLRSERATVVAEVASDEGVLRGTLAIDANLAAGSQAGASVLATLHSAGQPVTDVRMESR
jgi:NADH-quinone oxidoreductase subunit G